MRRIAALTLTVALLAGCGAPVLGPNLSAATSALGYRAIGGEAYQNFRLAPELPTSKEHRAAVKLTYLMNDDDAHQSPWSGVMLQMLDDLPQRNVHNVVFRDGGEMGDSRLYYLLKGDTAPKTIGNPQSPLAPGVNEVQSNNPRVFSQIVDWTFGAYKGQRKYLQIYTHGGGAFGIGTDERQTDLAGKELPKSQQLQVMRVHQFGEALRQGLKGSQLDLIYFRACLMSNVEALYELRGTTRYAVASEDVSYSKDNSNLTMTKLFDEMAGQNAEPAAVAKALAIQAHAKSVEVGGKHSGYTSFAAIDIGRMDELKTAINQLSRTLVGALGRHPREITAAYDATPEWSERDRGMRDLWAFTASLQQNVPDPAVKAAADAVRRAQEKAMLHAKDSFGSSANGLSIYMPLREKDNKRAAFLTQDYRQTRFAKDTAWDDFITAMVTGRLP